MISSPVTSTRACARIDIIVPNVAEDFIWTIVAWTSFVSTRDFVVIVVGHIVVLTVEVVGRTNVRYVFLTNKLIHVCIRHIVSNICRKIVVGYETRVTAVRVRVKRTVVHLEVVCFGND